MLQRPLVYRMEYCKSSINPPGGGLFTFRGSKVGLHRERDLRERGPNRGFTVRLEWSSAFQNLNVE